MFPRVCVMNSKRLGQAYVGLERCRVEIVAAFPSCTELTKEELAGFDVIVVRCDMADIPLASFRRAISRMSASRPTMAIVDEITPEIAIEAARAGFQGLLEHDVTPVAFDRAIEAVLRGELAYPRSTLSSLARSALAVGADPVRDIPFTKRERQVIALIARGATDERMGQALGISRSTAHKHVQSAMRRAKVKTRSQLVAAAAAVGATGARESAVLAS